MVVPDILTQKKTVIVRRWFDRVLETYPPDASRFMEKEKDRFANPVGATISSGLETIYKELLHEMNPETVSDALDGIIRIRSVQEFSPSQAIAFVFLLKRVIAEELESEFRDSRVFEELLSFDAKIDQLALIAFDTYMRCREKIFQIRVDEVKAQKEMALRLLEITHRTMENMRMGENLHNKGL